MAPKHPGQPVPHDRSEQADRALRADRTVRADRPLTQTRSVQADRPIHTDRPVRRKRAWDNQLPCTSEADFRNRRRFLRGTLALGAGSLIGVGLGKVIATQSSMTATQSSGPAHSEELLKTLQFWHESSFVGGDRNKRFKIQRAMTDEIVAASYNNFYEFTTDKDRVWRLAGNLTVRPWAVEITGEVEKPMTLDAEEIVRRMPIEERVYRLRCVEAWAMTVPWTGFPLKALMEIVKPTSRAKYVRFVSFNRPKEAVGQRPGSAWRWPYYEALSIEEAANELTFVASGIYGHELPKQHGAPLRLVIPWKYGYKSLKSVVKIEFTQDRPGTFWNDAVPAEYGFWSNVDPGKPHPRWSQATERLIGSDERVKTLAYNGYGEFVHHLYKGKSSAAL